MVIYLLKSHIFIIHQKPYFQREYGFFSVWEILVFYNEKMLRLQTLFIKKYIIKNEIDNSDTLLYIILRI